MPVRTLVEFVWRRGDLGGGGDFMGSDRALAGIRGHQMIQRSRPAGYEKEVCVSHEITTSECNLQVHGRVDGVLTTGSEVLVEEIKTVRGSWNRIADPVHWAQVKVYAFIYAHDHKLGAISIRLTYVDLESGETTEFDDRFSKEELEVFFQETALVYGQWVRDFYEWRQGRDESLRKLPFPFARYRAGQRELAVAAYKAVAGGGRLFVEAPTGVGKTMSVLFPALKALAEGNVDQIFYLTARTVGRTVAEKAVADLRQAGARVRALTLTAKDKVCVRDGRPCELASCPLAVGYYDRWKPAMREVLNQETITRPVLEEIGHKHQVCPFELSLDVSTWVDLVICDYNYAFDPQAYLRRHFAEPERRYAFFVDEAHNLVDRAREMFSADLETNLIDEIKRDLKETVPRCGRALAKLSTALKRTGRTTAPGAELSLGPNDQSDNDPPVEIRRGVLARRTLPGQLLPAVESALKEAEAWLVQNQPAPFREALLDLYFRLHAFRRTAEVYDQDYVTMTELGEGPRASMRVRLFCMDPSARLKAVYERARSVVLFSATLTPLEYYRALLGGEPQDRMLQFHSPFPPENLAVLMHDRIRTNLNARAESLAQVVETIGALTQGQPGNYLVYFPSYQYLKAARQLFEMQHPGTTVLEQQPGMTEPQREAFLAAFAHDRADTLVGFAALGGIFGEGIDLVGERLIGVVVVGVGLPQLCAERDLIRDYFQEKLGAGFDYAYTFPGMNRVLQAAGRVIRSESDRGFVMLIDSRFAETRYRRLFPEWWRPARVRYKEQIREAAVRFWAGTAREQHSASSE